MSKLTVILGLLITSLAAWSIPQEPNETLKQDILVYQSWIDQGIYHGQKPSPSWFDGRTECTTNRVRFESIVKGAYIRVNQDSKAEHVANSVIYIENGTHQFTLIEGEKEFSIQVRLDNRWQKELGYCRLKMPIANE